MKFRVLKEFRGNGQTFERGAEVDIESSPKVQGLIAQRFLLPIDASVVAATQAPAAKVAEKQAQRKSKSTPAPAASEGT